MAMKGIRFLSMPDETVIKMGPPYLLGVKNGAKMTRPGCQCCREAYQ